MPRIQDYTAQVDQLRPTETGVEALAMEGRRVGAFYDQAANTLRQSAADRARAAEGIAQGAETEARAFSGVAKSVAEAGDQAGQYITHQEISHGAATFAQLHSDLTEAWNAKVSDPKTDPNDVSIAGQFREQTLEPALDKFVSSFSTTQGQQWAENHAAALRDHMLEKQTADMSTLAADAVSVNSRQMTNAWTNAARSDPSSVPFLLKSVDSSFAGVIATSPNLKGVDAAKLHSQITQKAKEDIVRAGALGAIENAGDPEAAAAQFAKRYPDFVNAQEIDQFAKVAKMYNRAASADSERARRLAKEQAEDKSAAARDDKYIPDITGDNPKFTNKDILNAKDLTWEHKKELLGVLKTEGKDQDSDPQVLRSLVKGAFDPNNPTTESDVLRAKADGKISDKDFTKTYQFIKLSQDAAVDNPTYKETIRSTEKLFGNGPIGSERHAQFMQDFLPQYLKAKREGTAAGALDTRDPNSLISKVMADHMPSDAEKLRDRIARSTGIDVGAGAVTAPGERVAGQVYPTPRGPMRWTGTGWVQP